MTTCPNPYRGFRYPAEVIEYAVWLYHCFSLSLRDVETILTALGHSRPLTLNLTTPPQVMSPIVVGTNNSPATTLVRVSCCRFVGHAV